MDQRYVPPPHRRQRQPHGECPATRTWRRGYYMLFLVEQLRRPLGCSDTAVLSGAPAAALRSASRVALWRQVLGRRRAPPPDEFRAGASARRHSTVLYYRNPMDPRPPPGSGQGFDGHGLRSGVPRRRSAGDDNAISVSADARAPLGSVPNRSSRELPRRSGLGP